jgi:hypothetical protein
MELVLAHLIGESAELLCYDDVRQQLKAVGGAHRGLHDIPLGATVGSVGRCADFSRSFLPLRDEDQQRWIRVKTAVADLTGLPPIEVYRVGEVYFVFDGNHRVSVARQLGAPYIQAYVTEVHTKVPLSPDDLIIKTEYADFLGIPAWTNSARRPTWA